MQGAFEDAADLFGNIDDEGNAAPTVSNTESKPVTVGAPPLNTKIGNDPRDNHTETESDNGDEIIGNINTTKCVTKKQKVGLSKDYLTFDRVRDKWVVIRNNIIDLTCDYTAALNIIHNRPHYPLFDPKISRIMRTNYTKQDLQLVHTTFDGMSCESTLVSATGTSVGSACTFFNYACSTHGHSTSPFYTFEACCGNALIDFGQPQRIAIFVTDHYVPEAENATIVRAAKVRDTNVWTTTPLANVIADKHILVCVYEYVSKASCRPYTGDIEFCRDFTWMHAAGMHLNACFDDEPNVQSRFCEKPVRRISSEVTTSILPGYTYLCEDCSFYYIAPKFN